MAKKDNELDIQDDYSAHNRPKKGKGKKTTLPKYGKFRTLPCETGHWTLPKTYHEERNFEFHKIKVAIKDKKFPLQTSAVIFN